MVVVTVKDFQAIGHASLVAEGLTVIVGPSDRGKSALLRAVESALFNRSGDGFVRVGRTTARVQLVLNSGTRHDVIWEKGGGVNRFMVDGQEYGRVGRDAPPVLKDLGFRDELIGGKVTDNGNTVGGEVMRPQIARQFDQIFLLDQSGSFVNETMVKLSRLGVLQRANRLCTSDLREAKQRLAAQQELALNFRASADKLAPVVPLRARVETLAQMMVDVEAAEARLIALRALAFQRKVWLPLASVVLPTRPPIEATIRRGLVTATLRSYVTQRGFLRRYVVELPTAPRPEKRWWKRGESLGLLGPLLAERARVSAQARVLPPPRQPDQKALARIWLHPQLRLLVEKRVEELRVLRVLSDWVTQWTAAHAAAQADLDEFKAKLRVCPVCEKPF